MRKTIISVISLEKNSHLQKRIILKLLKESGLKGWSCTGVSTIYGLEGNLFADDILRAERELFCDPVIEICAVQAKPKNGFIFADVWYRSGVTDPASESILKALMDLKINSIQNAHSGTRYKFVNKNLFFYRRPREKQKLIKFVTQNLLNPLIQECSLTSYDC